MDVQPRGPGKTHDPPQCQGACPGSLIALRKYVTVIPNGSTKLAHTDSKMGTDTAREGGRVSLRHSGCLQLSLAEQIRLVLPHVLGMELVGRAVKVAGESDRTHVTAYGTLRVIPTLEFFEHHLA